MIAFFLQETTTATEQESGAVSKLLADPLLPSWLAAFFALITVIPLAVAAWRWLRRWWKTRHLPRNTQVHQDRANYVLLLDKYEAYLTLLRNVLIIRSQTQHANVADNPEVVQKMVETRDGLYQILEKQGEDESEMGDLQKLDHLESRNVGIEDLIERRRKLEDLQAEIENHPLFIPRDQDSG